jgi:hypothetical protein
VERYEDSCLLCYVRGTERIIVELAGADRLRLRPAANRFASVSGRPGAGSATARSIHDADQSGDR